MSTEEHIEAKEFDQGEMDGVLAADPEADAAYEAADADRAEQAEAAYEAADADRAEETTEPDASAGSRTPIEPVEPVEPAEQPPTANPPVHHEPLLTPEDRQGFLDRWSDVQVGFVDDPLGAVRSAETLIEDIAAAYSAAFDARREELAMWREEQQDTESLRLALQRYRSFVGVVLPK